MRIQYAVDNETGLVVSRVGSEVAWPILDWDAMQPFNSFATNYRLERLPVFSVVDSWGNLKWTRKVPVDVKNVHRQFWGMKPLRTD